VLDLRTGIEHELSLPPDGGQPRRIGWTPDGAAVLVGARRGVYRFDLPFRGVKPRALAPAERAAAESSFAVLLGEPVFARVVRCEGGQSLCAAGDTGVAELLARGARDAVRWGADSVAYFIGDALEVRPLSAGRVRRVRWSDPPPRPRAMTFFSGGAPSRGP
jgi:hypothetical protein